MQSYGYDSVDRLTQHVDLTSLVSDYQYDANGNRTQLTQGGVTTAYNIPLTSNRLSSQSGTANKSYTYDAAGNLVNDGVFTYTYNVQNRLTGAVSRKGKTDYTHNGLGQRVRKAQKDKATYYVYDENGHLMGEYDRKGRAVQETVYFNDTPVAVLQGKRIYYIYTDHLDTPRVIVNRANKVIWRWDSDPFGNASPRKGKEDDDHDNDDDHDEGENDDDEFTYNLRFPGQYFDKETGLHYNYFRDYNPGTGRYIQSDPIGLAGGLNTYSYVYNNPLSFVDPDGLRAFKIPSPIQKFWNELKFEGPRPSRTKPNQGMVCQISYKKQPIFRVDVHPIDRIERTPVPHWHMAPDMLRHREMPDFMGEWMKNILRGSS